MITAEKIGIESSIGFESVYRMEISVKPNRHGKLFLQGILSPESEQQGENWDNSQIRVVMLDEHGKSGKTIFHGILRDSYVYHENGVREVIVTSPLHIPPCRSASVRRQRQLRLWDRTIRSVSGPISQEADSLSAMNSPAMTTMISGTW